MREAVNGIIIQDNRLLLVKKRQTWIFPGGKPTEGESDERCLIREFREELPSSRVSNPRFYDVFCGKTPHVGDTLEARAYFLDFSGEVTPSSEISDAKWFELSEIGEYLISDISLKIIDSLKRGGYLK